MSDFDDKINEIFASGEERGKRLFELLTADDDLITVVLRSHLIMEELLFTAISAHCDHPEYLENAQLRFPQLISLFRSLQKIPLANDQEWNSLYELNSLRNAIAHKVEPQDVTVRIEKLVKMILGDEEIKQLSDPLYSTKSLRTAMAYLLGRLQVIAIFQSALEELIMNQLREANKAGNRDRKGS